MDLHFFEKLEKYSSNKALISEDSNSLSYEELNKESKKVAKKLKARTLVLMISKNDLASLIFYIACLKAKAVPILLGSNISSKNFFRIFNEYKPSYVFVSKEYLSELENYKKLTEIGNHLLCELNNQIDYEIEENLALLMTTSGSTGSPKLVRLSYDNLQSNSESICEYLDIKPSDRAITSLPMSYSYGLSVINSHLNSGASIIITDKSLVEKEFWNLIKEHKATSLSGVPYTYEMLKKLKFGLMHLPNLRYLTQAGGKLSEELQAYFADICLEKGIKFFIMYGQTEATARISYLPYKKVSKKIGSIGLPIPNCSLWIQDDEGNQIEEINTPGELVLKGENVSLGYSESCYDLNKEDLNNGILHTGDIAKKDEDGFYFIVGRKKRFLKIFGNRINLDEIESYLKSLNLDCVCSGTDDNLVIYYSEEINEKDLKHQISNFTGLNKKGFSTKLIKEIPRNAYGKTLYSKLDST